MKQYVIIVRKDKFNHDTSIKLPTTLHWPTPSKNTESYAFRKVIYQSKANLF